MAAVALGASSDSSIPFNNQSTASRITRENRRITYELTVIQQPERARACGSGAKSSTDRRPVDPPPIVKFRIFEGDGPHQTEITSPYNANFFLYATLEVARPIAYPRGTQPPESANRPVLTGTPVAGIAYLERPDKAGYFIFPDLSVRHEGKYRLTFTLFEDTKDAKDKDPEEENAPTSQANRRLEVKSGPFTVYSAKKFPGLSESTALSRLVADQGCRVRIRRDVRMRRRENKASQHWDDYEDETAQERARATATPDPYSASTMPTPQPILDPVDRPRSTSASSCSASLQRRHSLQEMAQEYTQTQLPSQATPGTPQTGYTPHMSYYHHPHHQSHFAVPPQIMQPSLQTYNFSAPMHIPQNYAFSAHAQMSPMFEQSPNHSRYDSHGHASLHNSSVIAEYPYSRPQSSQQAYANIPHLPPTPTIPSSDGQATSSHALPPLKTLQPAIEVYDQASPNTPLQDQQLAPRTQPAQYVSHSNGAPGKRSYGSVFNTHHIDQRLQSGARPDSSPFEPSSKGQDNNSDEDSEDLRELRLNYRRADGTQVSKLLPNSA